MSGESPLLDLAAGNTTLRQLYETAEKTGFKVTVIVMPGSFEMRFGDKSEPEAAIEPSPLREAITKLAGEWESVAAYQPSTKLIPEGAAARLREALKLPG